MTRQRLLQNLTSARIQLLDAQTNLALVRKLTGWNRSIPIAEAAVCRCLDRVWEAQCMAEGVFHV